MLWNILYPYVLKCEICDSSEKDASWFHRFHLNWDLYLSTSAWLLKVTVAYLTRAVSPYNITLILSRISYNSKLINTSKVLQLLWIHIMVCDSWRVKNLPVLIYLFSFLVENCGFFSTFLNNKNLFFVMLINFEILLMCAKAMKMYALYE